MYHYSQNPGHDTPVFCDKYQQPTILKHKTWRSSRLFINDRSHKLYWPLNKQEIGSNISCTIRDWEERTGGRKMECFQSKDSYYNNHHQFASYTNGIICHTTSACTNITFFNIHLLIFSYTTISIYVMTLQTCKLCGYYNTLKYFQRWRQLI